MKTKLFAGLLLTSEIKMHLAKSTSWHNAQLESGSFCEVPYESKEYLGRYLDQERLAVQDLKDLQAEIEKLMGNCCPELAGRSFELKLFTHTLIA